MKVIQKKVCLLGDFGVGKTSLVARTVKNEFPDKYLTTVGVKMDTKSVSVSDDLDVKVILWDIAGDSFLNSKAMSYIRGSAGFIFVADGTRMNTLNSVLQINSEADRLLGDLPFVLLVNKHDLTEQWDVSELALENLKNRGGQIFYTSAKTGENVELALTTLAHNLVA
jgi:small GTP-binding protein